MQPLPASLTPTLIVLVTPDTVNPLSFGYSFPTSHQRAYCEDPMRFDVIFAVEGSLKPPDDTGKVGTLKLAPSQGVEVFVNPSRRRGTPMWAITWARKPMSKSLILVKNSKSGGVLYSTLRGVRVEVWGTPSYGSGRSPWGSRLNSLKTKIKWREWIITSLEETWWPRTALRYLKAVIKDRS